MKWLLFTNHFHPNLISIWWISNTTLLFLCLCVGGACVFTSNWGGLYEYTPSNHRHIRNRGWSMCCNKVKDDWNGANLVHVLCLLEVQDHVPCWIVPNHITSMVWWFTAEIVCPRLEVTYLWSSFEGSVRVCVCGGWVCEKGVFCIR